MMSGVVPLLSASVVSTVVLRPSTVYVLRVESARSRGVWHVRRCFAEFCELRDKLLAAATAFRPASGGDCASSRSSSRRGSGDAEEQDSPTSSGGSAKSSPTQATPSPPHSQAQQGSGSADKFAFLLEEFPTRRRFWSRSVVRRRATALNAFLQQALEFARDARASQQIAVYFSVTTHLEAFLGCAEHADDAFLCGSMAWGGTLSSSSAMRPRPTLDQYPVTPIQTSSLSSKCETSKWRCAADRWRGAHDSDSDSDSDRDCDSDIERPLNHDTSTLHARRHNCSPTENDRDVDEELLIVGMARADLSRQLCLRPRIFHPFDNYDGDEAKGDDERDDHNDNESDVASEDDELEATCLRKAASAALPRETREMRLYYTGSHYAPLQKGRKEGMTASAAWAARVEVAGIRAMTGKQDAPLRTPVPIYPCISRRRSWKSIGSAVDRDDRIKPTKAEVLKNNKAKRPHRHHLPFGRAIRADRRPECA